MITIKFYNKNQNNSLFLYQVAGQILWVGMASYVKVCVAQVFRERGHKHSLLWYGAVVQLGSMTGAFSLFPIVQDGTFKSGNSCANNCAWSTNEIVFFRVSCSLSKSYAQKRSVFMRIIKSICRNFLTGKVIKKCVL